MGEEDSLCLQGDSRASSSWIPGSGISLYPIWVPQGFLLQWRDLSRDWEPLSQWDKFTLPYWFNANTPRPFYIIPLRCAPLVMLIPILDSLWHNQPTQSGPSSRKDICRDYGQVSLGKLTPSPANISTLILTHLYVVNCHFLLVEYCKKENLISRGIFLFSGIYIWPKN